VEEAVIALTPEMRAAAARRMGVDDLDPWMAAALVDVLTIYARDHLRPTLGPDRCSACGRTARNLTPVTELVDGRPTVVARLGPSCYQRATRTANAGRQPLPIGGNHG
jgi:hypothetical protein